MKATDAYDFRQACITSDAHMRAALAESIQKQKEEIEIFKEDVDDADVHDFIITDVIENEAPEEETTMHEEEEMLDEALLVCFYCDEYIETENELAEHIAIFHAEEEEVSEVQAEQTVERSTRSNKRHECHICAKRFETPSKLHRHMSVHRDVLDPSELPPVMPKDYKHSCHVCGKRVETPSKLQRHLRVHDKNAMTYSGINQHRPFACPDCDLRFWTEIKQERHMIIHSLAVEQSVIHHPEGYMFTCVICLHKLPDYEECIEHMKAHREDVGDNIETQCKLCLKTYPKISNLIRHSKSHSENATHQCVHCNKQMGMGDDFIDHMLRHENFKPYTCSYQSCGKGYTKHHKLVQHMILHETSTTKPYTCDKCAKRFSGLEYLKRHLLRHSGRKDHLCMQCPARFTFKSGLTTHMTTHSKVKLYSCEICLSQFSKMQSLRVHQKIHSGEVN